jgi:hypothetical protein
VKQEDLRAWWFHRQGLDEPQKLGAAKVLEKVGWSRSVGGSNPYLSIHARTGASRAEIDNAVAKEEIHELPSARGCTYVVPKNHYAVALLVGQPTAGDSPDLVGAKKFLGVTEKEIEKLEKKVVDAISKEAKDPREIKEIVGDAARSLGEEGKKRGTTTTLPLALGRLQNNGRIRRISTDGRLDNQRYKYVAWNPSPLEGAKLSRDEAFEKLAKIYFKWIGPATVANFQWFTGLNGRDAKITLESLKLQPIEKDRPLLILAEDLDEFQSFKRPKDERIALVGGIDGLVLLRRELQDFVDEKDRGRRTPGGKGGISLGAGPDLDSHGIFDRGRLIGIWEFDPEANEVVHNLFVPATTAIKRAIKSMETFVGEDLGDARSFSLDSPASRKPRIAALRGARGS